MIKYEFRLPQDFDESEWEITAKGWYSQGELFVGDNRYPLTFYDKVRLSQEIDDDVTRRDVFFEPNLIVVSSLTRKQMEVAIKFIVDTNQVGDLVAK